MTRPGRQLLQAAALAAVVTGMGVGGIMLQDNRDGAAGHGRGPDLRG